MTGIRGPQGAITLFHTPRWAAFWAILRVWLGWQWLQAGWHKLFDPAWMETGQAVRGFWARAVVVPETGRPPITYDTYRSFIQFLLDGGHHTWFAKLVAYGETLVGIALILGAFTGIAAAVAAFMNLNFMLAGTTSTNPVLFTAAILLVAAWKVAGWWGLDRWLLHQVGTPWQPGRLLNRWRPMLRGPQA